MYHPASAPSFQARKFHPHPKEFRNWGSWHQFIWVWQSSDGESDERDLNIARSLGEVLHAPAEISQRRSHCTSCGSQGHLLTASAGTSPVFCNIAVWVVGPIEATANRVLALGIFSGTAR